MRQYMKPKPVYEVGFIREKGKATARAFSRGSLLK
jgi:hypothetical protein